MTSANPLFAPQQISTEGFPAARRLAMWREVYGRNLTRVDIDQIGNEPFQASVTFQSLPGIALVSGSRSAAHYRITRQHLAHARDGVGLSVLTDGASTTQQLGREVVLRPGAAVVIAGTDPSVSTMHRPGSFVTLSLPRPQLAALVPDLGSTYARQIPAENEALRLLVHYVAALHRAGSLGTPTIAEVASRHIMDLAALALGASADAAHEARQGGLAAARLAAIKAVVRDDLGNRELSVAMVAARLGVSPRYVHKLFEREGMTFSGFVLGRRLDRALKMLTDASCAELTISTIAFDCGFSDLSYFNRSFRRVYGATPSDIRESARRAAFSLRR